MTRQINPEERNAQRFLTPRPEGSVTSGHRYSRVLGCCLSAAFDAAAQTIGPRRGWFTTGVRPAARLSR